MCPTMPRITRRMTHAKKWPETPWNHGAIQRFIKDMRCQVIWGRGSGVEYWKSWGIQNELELDFFETILIFRLITWTYILWDVVFFFFLCILLVVVFVWILWNSKSGCYLEDSETNLQEIIRARCEWSPHDAIWDDVGFGWCETKQQKILTVTLRVPGVHCKMDFPGTPHGISPSRNDAPTHIVVHHVRISMLFGGVKLPPDPCITNDEWLKSRCKWQ